MFELCITVMVSHVFMEFVLFHLVEKSQCFFFTQVESAPNKKKLLSSRYRCLGSSLRGILPARQCTRSNRLICQSEVTKWWLHLPRQASHVVYVLITFRESAVRNMELGVGCDDPFEIIAKI